MPVQATREASGETHRMTITVKTPVQYTNYGDTQNLILLEIKDTAHTSSGRV